MHDLPFVIGHVGVPPLKCQGIKTKLVPFIFSNIKWVPTDKALWIEPFLGSGVVAFNLAPEYALLADTNHHIIRLYTAIQQGEIESTNLREFLVNEGKKLERYGGAHYYEVRERFNREGSPFDFLFLNRSCFNGVMRFNRHGAYNVPFGHKPERFTPSYITKIVNQVRWAARQMRGKNWEFRVATWEETLTAAQPGDFVYMDPPYIGRHTDYYTTWDEDQATRLAALAQRLPCGFALSMWLENRHRKNPHIEECWSGCEIRICGHYYHVGAVENNRNEIDEALVIRPGFAPADMGKHSVRKVRTMIQLPMPL